MEFAVIKTGGKQYRVKKGDVLTIEKLSEKGAPIAEGSKIVFDQVLLVDDGKDVMVGTPVLSGASVAATVEKQGKTRTLVVSKFKNKVGYRKRIGHRHRFTKVTIDSIKTK